MFARRWRLVRDRDFQAAYRRGHRLRGKAFVLVVHKLPTLEPMRMAVVVAGRVDKRATRRNLLKRRTWAALRSYRAQLPKAGYHLVWLVQPPAKALDYATLAHEVASLLSQLS